MGEAKQRKTFSQRIREDQPFCIFCGGETPSETVEHWVATFSRMMPDAKTAAGRAEVKRLIDSALRIPGFAKEVYPEWNQLGVLKRYQNIAPRLPSWNFVRLDGPIVARAFTIFASKLALALHTTMTGRILPPEGVITVQWYSNLDAYNGELPREFIAMCGPSRTLRQGNFQVGEQFRVASVVPDDSGYMSGHFASFRDSFGVLMFATERADELKNGWSVSPGFLKRPLTVIPVPQTLS